MTSANENHEPESSISSGTAATDQERGAAAQGPAYSQLPRSRASPNRIPEYATTGAKQLDVGPNLLDVTYVLPPLLRSSSLTYNVTVELHRLEFHQSRPTPQPTSAY